MKIGEKGEHESERAREREEGRLDPDHISCAQVRAQQKTTLASE
jgi:hypothetical protein